MISFVDGYFILSLRRIYVTVVKIVTGLLSVCHKYASVQWILYIVRINCLFSAVQVNAVAFSPDEKHFATCSEDGSVRVWSVSSIELVVQFQVLGQVREYV